MFLPYHLSVSESVNIDDQSLPFIARFCLVLLFPFSALDKIFDYGVAVTQADASGLPVPGWLLLGGSLEVFGSLGILLNLYARPLALLFCFYCVATAVLFHNFWIYTVRQRGLAEQLLAVSQELRVGGRRVQPAVRAI